MSEEPPPLSDSAQALLDAMGRLLQNVSASHRASMELMSAHYRSLLLPGFDSPEGRGWLRMVALLQEAVADETVKASSPALGFLAIVLELAEDNMPREGDDGSEPFEPLVSMNAVNAGKRRHSALDGAREWVRAEWQLHRAAYEGNKSRFADDYASRCAREKDVKVTARTIRESWLKS